MRLDTAASLSTRHADLVAEAHAARLAGSPSISLGSALRRAGSQLATTFADVRGARIVAPTAAKSAAKS